MWLHQQGNLHEQHPQNQEISGIMAKKSQRCPVRYRKDQTGCIWSFISIFDFHHGRSTRRLLSGRRHPSGEISGNNMNLEARQLQNVLFNIYAFVLHSGSRSLRISTQNNVHGESFCVQK